MLCPLAVVVQRNQAVGAVVVQWDQVEAQDAACCAARKPHRNVAVHGSGNCRHVRDGGQCGLLAAHARVAGLRRLRRCHVPARHAQHGLMNIAPCMLHGGSRRPRLWPAGGRPKLGSAAAVAAGLRYLRPAVARGLGGRPGRSLGSAGADEQLGLVQLRFGRSLRCVAQRRPLARVGLGLVGPGERACQARPAAKPRSSTSPHPYARPPLQRSAGNKSALLRARRRATSRVAAARPPLAAVRCGSAAALLAAPFRAHEVLSGTLDAPQTQLGGPVASREHTRVAAAAACVVARRSAESALARSRRAAWLNCAPLGAPSSRLGRVCQRPLPACSPSDRAGTFTGMRPRSAPRGGS
eukprot:362063-Chlamydomonas_euryale.AAC.5